MHTTNSFAGSGVGVGGNCVGAAAGVAVSAGSSTGSDVVASGAAAVLVTAEPTLVGAGAVASFWQAASSRTIKRVMGKCRTTYFLNQMMFVSKPHKVYAFNAADRALLMLNDCCRLPNDDPPKIYAIYGGQSGAAVNRQPAAQREPRSL